MIDKDAPKFIYEFQRDYAHALAEARKSAELTATVFWQALYAGHLLERTRLLGGLAAELRFAADVVQRDRIDETTIKSIKDYLKLMEAASDAEVVWQRDVVQPIRKPAELPGEIIEARRAIVASMTKSNPLFSEGLAERFAEEAAMLTKVRWDAGLGVAIILDPLQVELSAVLE